MKFKLLLLALLIIAANGCQTFQKSPTPEPSHVSKVREVEKGMSRAEIYKLLGRPDKRHEESSVIWNMRYPKDAEIIDKFIIKFDGSDKVISMDWLELKGKPSKTIDLSIYED